MYVFPDGVIDEYRVNPECRINNNCTGGGTSKDYRETLYANCLNSTGASWTEGCFGKILNDNWQMTY